MTGNTNDKVNKIDSMPYAIDCEVTKRGRRLAGTKRRVKFSFGFGNKQAMEQGHSGAQCRGEEHEVVMVWSLTSGKQRVLADGVEVHFSRQPFAEKFECKWTMPSGHEVQVVGTWAASMRKSENDRLFDLKIDGLSFWKMPKMFQLGHGNASALPMRRRSLTPTEPANARYLRSQSMPQIIIDKDGVDLLDVSTTPSTVDTLPSPTSVSILWDEVDTKVPSAPALSQPKTTYTMMDSTWHAPSRTSQSLVTPNSSMHSRSVQMDSENPFEDLSVHSRSDMSVSENSTVSQVERALKSLVDMDVPSTPYSMTPNTSVSDFNDLVSPAQRSAVFTFAG